MNEIEKFYEDVKGTYASSCHDNVWRYDREKKKFDKQCAELLQGTPDGLSLKDSIVMISIPLINGNSRIIMKGYRILNQTMGGRKEGATAEEIRCEYIDAKGFFNRPVGKGSPITLYKFLSYYTYVNCFADILVSEAVSEEYEEFRPDKHR